MGKYKNTQIIKIRLAHATVTKPPIASLHLFLLQNASFFIFVAYNNKYLYILLYLVCNRMNFLGSLYY